MTNVVAMESRLARAPKDVYRWSFLQQEWQPVRVYAIARRFPFPPAVALSSSWKVKSHRRLPGGGTETVWRNKFAAIERSDVRLRLRGPWRTSFSAVALPGRSFGSLAELCAAMEEGR